jgi:uncharacterized protein YbjT (DUF2867 family)
MATLAEKRIVVIGGNGTLGSAAVEAALGAGALVTVLSRHASASGGASAIGGSITDPIAVRQATEGAAGIVISVEASRTPEQLRAVYVEGTRNVLSSAPEEAHIVFMGHIGVTDIERMPDYNRAKLEAERLIRSSGRPYTIIRPAWVVGRDTGVKLEQGDRYSGRRDDIGHRELGQAIVAAFENAEGRGKTFELYGGVDRDPSWRELLAGLAPDETVR